MAGTDMKSTAFFGKGGIGKSTLSSNISAVLGRMGHRVLHAGCDPKMDSSLSLAGRNITPFSAAGMKPEEHILRSMIVPSPFVKGVDCVEAGGPEPGLGCAGVAIGTLLDAIRAEGLAEDGTYDRMVFDVLGDVVCGGFAAPLKKGFAKKAVIVTSEEILSLYAANNLLRMMRNYARNGVYAAGLALNVRNRSEIGNAERYAAAAGLPVLGIVYRDDAVYEAAKAGRPAVLGSPKSEFARSIVRLAIAIEKAERPAAPARPLSEAEFAAFAAGEDISSADSAEAGRAIYAPAKLTQGYLAGLNLRLYGLEEGRVLLEHQGRRKLSTVVIAPAAAGHSGTVKHGDWSAYIKPETDGMGRPVPGTGEMSQEIQEALKELCGFRYRDMLGIACESADMQSAVTGIAGIAQTSPKITPYADFQSAKNDKFIFRIDPYWAPPSLMVEHSDAECRFNDPPLGNMLSYFSTRTEKRAHVPRFPGKCYFNTDIMLPDFVHDSDRKFERCVTGINEYEKKEVKIHMGCTPALTESSSFEDMCSNLSAETGMLLTLEAMRAEGCTHKASNEHINVAMMMEKYSEARKEYVSSGQKDFDVCLIDYGADSAPLKEFLEGRGLSVVVQEDFLVDAPASAAVQLCGDPDNYKSIAFRADSVPMVAEKYPYGFSQSKGWLADIKKKLAAAGVKKDFNDEPSAEETAAFSRRLEKAKNIRFAFAGSEKELKSLNERKLCWPASQAADFLLSCGIRPVLFYEEFPGSAEKMSGLAKKFDAVCCRPGELYAEMIKKNIDLIYSDIRNDSRILRLGKHSFSSAMIEPGYAGAAETLRRFADMLEMPL